VARAIGGARREIRQGGAGVELLLQRAGVVGRVANETDRARGSVRALHEIVVDAAAKRPGKRDAYYFRISYHLEIAADFTLLLALTEGGCQRRGRCL
jgi:hypothetical protein